MQAAISGRAGIAVLRDTDRWFILYADAPEQQIPCHPGFQNRLLSVARDLVFLQPTTPTEAGRHLTNERASVRALDHFLFLLDLELPDSVREDAIQELVTIFPGAEK